MPRSTSVAADPPSSQAGLLASPVRREIVDRLSNLTNQQSDGHPGLTASALGELLNLHVTTVRFHLDQLVAAGLLDSRFVRSAGKGRPRKVYSTAAGDLHDAVDGAHQEAAFNHLAGLLTENFMSPTRRTPEEAGRQWALSHTEESLAEEIDPTQATTTGQWLGKVGQMIDVLKDWGYTPEVQLDATGHSARVNLRDCPFIDLARDHTAVVCGIHRGLIKGSMEALGEPEAEVGLEPFVGPHLCVAQVTTPTQFTSRIRRQAAPTSIASGATETLPAAEATEAAEAPKAPRAANATPAHHEATARGDEQDTPAADELHNRGAV